MLQKCEAPGAGTGEGPERWFIAQLKPGGAGAALRNLARQGFPAFLPRQRVTRRRANRLVSATEPVFPGYVFVGFDPAAAPWRRIASTYGVARLLTTPDQRPAEVPAAFLSALRARCDAEGVLEAAPALKSGDRVRLMAGPFTEMLGRIETLDGAGRVTVLLEILGQSVRVNLTARELRLASAG